MHDDSTIYDSADAAAWASTIRSDTPGEVTDPADPSHVTPAPYAVDHDGIGRCCWHDRCSSAIVSATSFPVMIETPYELTIPDEDAAGALSASLLVSNAVAGGRLRAAAGRLCAYVGASGRCSGVAQPGAKALMAWFLAAYAGRGGRNLGIYNCRYIAGTRTWSLHSEGRACDLGIPFDLGRVWAWPLMHALADRSSALGIQLIIFDSLYWSASKCNQGWLPFPGANKHRDHAHVELSPHAARTLTVDQISVAMATPETDWTQEVLVQLPQIKQGNAGPMVARAQALLAAAGYAPSNSFTTDHKPDGIFGPGTTSAVRLFQDRRDLDVDGIVGPHTWRALLSD